MAKQKFNILSSIKNEQRSEFAPTPENTSRLVSAMIERLDTPKETTPLDCYKIIPRNKVRDNKKNDYPIVEMESLKESILHFGLIQDIVVIYLMEEDMYVIEAGHRRRAAIDELIGEFADYHGDDAERYALYRKNVEKYERGYVCKVSGTILESDTYDSEHEEDLDTLSDDAIDSEIRLIITNNEVRSEDVRTKTRNIQRLTKLYERKNKNLPGGQKINVNQQIGKDVNLKTRQIAYYKNVEGLIPGLQEAFFSKKITLKEGSGIAKLPKEEQEEILQLINDKASKDELKETITVLKKRIGELENTDPTGSCVEKLLKADMKWKNCFDQTLRSVHTLLKSIENYRKLQANDSEIEKLSISSAEDIEKSMQVLLKLLS